MPACEYCGDRKGGCHKCLPFNNPDLDRLHHGPGTPCPHCARLRDREGLAKALGRHYNNSGSWLIYADAIIKYVEEG